MKTAPCGTSSAAISPLALARNLVFAAVGIVDRVEAGNRVAADSSRAGYLESPSFPAVLGSGARRWEIPGLGRRRVLLPRLEQLTVSLPILARIIPGIWVIRTTVSLQVLASGHTEWRRWAVLVLGHAWEREEDRAKKS